jgi:hypothetical protein
MDMPPVRQEESSGRTPGRLFESLRTLLATLGEMARTRAELLGNELEQELRRIVERLVGAMIVLALTRPTMSGDRSGSWMPRSLLRGTRPHIPRCWRASPSWRPSCCGPAASFGC